MALKNKTHDIDKAPIVQRAPQQHVAHAPNEHERPLNTASALKRAISAHPAALRPADILALQRTVGNRAVHRLLAGQAQGSPASESQGRQPIQTKLTVGAAGDKYEQEADRVASQIMSMDAQTASPSIQRTSEMEEEAQRKPAAFPITPLVQREITLEGEEQGAGSIQRQTTSEPTIAAPGIENAIGQARGSGQPLPQGVRSRMESAFGADLSGVRVHTDDRADNLNRSLQSCAFTTGRDLFFKRGEYNPDSRAGQELIAHELTHVAQQQAMGKKSEEANKGVMRRTGSVRVEQRSNAQGVQRWRKYPPTMPAIKEYVGGGLMMEQVSGKYHISIQKVGNFWQLLHVTWESEGVAKDEKGSDKKGSDKEYPHSYYKEVEAGKLEDDDKGLKKESNKKWIEAANLSGFPLKQKWAALDKAARNIIRPFLTKIAKTDKFMTYEQTQAAAPAVTTTPAPDTKT
jgi:hypothetical protein